MQGIRRGLRPQRPAPFSWAAPNFPAGRSDPHNAAARSADQNREVSYMTTLDTIRDAIPDYARDLKLNLGSVLATTGAPGLTDKQIWAVALASAIASRNVSLTRDIESLAAAHLDASHVNGARSAAAVMGMNNIYYRFLHLVEDPEYAQM